MNKKFKNWKFIVSLIIIIVVVIAGLVIIPRQTEKQNDSREVNVVSTLEKIINTSELFTYMATYNGIAQVMNKENTEQINYYVSYEAKVKVGIDFEHITINIDETAKTIYITLPPIDNIEIDVDIASLDFIFFNDKANTTSVSQEAFTECKKDAQNEVEQQETIIELAIQNAENILSALTRPIFDQIYNDYILIIE